MQTAKANNWLTSSGKEQIEFYIHAADIIVLERKRSVKLIADILGYHYDEVSNLNILDLACGDGSITDTLRQRYPQNKFFLMDGSSEMLTKAQTRLGQSGFHFRRQSFEEYIDQEDEPGKYQFVFSSMAVHHLDYSGKTMLYAKLFRELAADGLFLIYDMVLPPSDRSETWQFRMWVDWMNERLVETGNEHSVAKYNNLPNIYKSKSENQPSPLPDQLEALRKIGFRDVDCYYKYGVFALFGGSKQPF